MFHTGENAKKIFNTNEMVKWFAGAARLDAGLALAEKVSEMAKTVNPGRLQITVVVSGTAPFQNSASVYTAREGACKANADKIKERGVIVTLGDYNKSSGPDDTIDNQGINVDITTENPLGSGKADPDKDYPVKISAVSGKRLPLQIGVLAGTTELNLGTDYNYNPDTGEIIVFEKHFPRPININAVAIAADRKVTAMAYTGTMADPAIPSAKTYTKDTVGGEVSKNDVHEGDSVTLEAVLNTGYEFIGWYDNDLFNTACISQLPQHTIPIVGLTADADNPQYALFVSTADKDYFVPILGSGSPGGTPASAREMDDTEKEKEIAKITTELPPIVVDVEEDTLSEISENVVELPDPNDIQASQWVAVEINGVKTFFTEDRR